MPPTRCRVCRDLVPAGVRCCTGTTRTGYDAAERERRRRLVADHLEAYGPHCPGWHRQPHLSHDLTADHVVAVAAGGDPHGLLQVLCRSCNGRKAAQT